MYLVLCGDVERDDHDAAGGEHNDADDGESHREPLNVVQEVVGVAQVAPGVAQVQAGNDDIK